ncbi:calmodulin-like protein 7 [Vigna unguiculata]|uniref:Calcium-binding protein CML n=1 Tax=Vigna unguiculata TaxID=3917 RepID=A0A4D6KSH7_VIGUN|nr:calmodulin-like protein 7 [Vigna unguiculata]QCD80627.1 calcium-binding protein CML [Vigna unguiculata]QCD80628.1 calcium-binding protein CML [Vigna unguiculata]
MDLSTLLLALLFVAGLINVFFHVPTNKITTCLQIFLPNSACKTKTTLAPSPTAKAEHGSSGKKKELERVFSTFDKNGDGFVTKQELRESLRNIGILMTDREVDDIVVKYDSNGDGLIDFEEFCLLTSECMGGKKEEEEEDEEEEEEEINLKEAFDVFDKDNDGVISVEELALVLTSLGLKEGNKSEECREMIKKVDMDGDGMVNFKEFKRMMMKGGKLTLFNA